MQHVLKRFLTLGPKRNVIADVQEHVGLDERFRGLYRLRDIREFEGGRRTPRIRFKVGPVGGIEEPKFDDERLQQRQIGGLVVERVG